MRSLGKYKSLKDPFKFSTSLSRSHKGNFLYVYQTEDVGTLHYGSDSVLNSVLKI